METTFNGIKDVLGILVASFLGSGINGNKPLHDVPMKSYKVASFLGSGINGNVLDYHFYHWQPRSLPF